VSVGAAVGRGLWSGVAIGLLRGVDAWGNAASHKSVDRWAIGSVTLVSATLFVLTLKIAPLGTETSKYDSVREMLLADLA
jgi:hypothetical protein